MKYKLTIRFYEGNIKFFGKGVMQLLEGVAQEGSLNRAAAGMDMSYSKAWRLIKTAEHSLKFKLLITKSGGKDGGGAVLTPQAQEFMDKYKTFIARCDADVNSIFQEIFGR